MRKMAISSTLLFLSLTFIAVLPAFGVLWVPLASAISNPEVQALVLFKAGITQDPLGWLASWPDSGNTNYTSRPCSSSSSYDQPAVANHGAGIFCDAQQLHVVALNLRSFNLSGSISSSLALLPRLALLDLSHNHLSGQLPASLFNGAQFTSSLQHLNLSFNLLSGNLPHAIGNLSALTELDLSHNLFKGPLPTSIWHLPKLHLLWLESPGGTAPLHASLPVGLFKFCPTIKDIRLRGLALAGQLPASLSQCKQLQFLVLHDNGLQGIIPEGIWQLSALRILYLVETVHTAGLQVEPVPEILSFCSTIEQLWLQGFELTTSATRYTSPSLGDCKQLEVLILDVGGNLPSGFVMPGIWQLPQLRVLTWVNFQSENAINSFQISGSLPESFGFCSTVTHLHIEGVNLTGVIPPSLGRCEGLQYLELSHTGLHGAVPAAIQNLTHLQRLSLASNFLTGGIPTWISNLSELTHLDLRENPLGGRLPAEIGQLKQLQVLSLFAANLSGPVPEQLGNCPQLKWLDLGSSSIYPNQVEGFPKSLARLTKLKMLAWSGDVSAPFDVLMDVLSKLTLLEHISAPSCGIYGGIPPQLGDVLPHLAYVDLSSNELTGLIPPQLGNLSQLTSLNLLNNHLDGPLPNQLAHLSSELQYLSVGINNFTGSIPPWLGQFPKLRYLNLGTNKFSDSIPYQFLAGPNSSSIEELFMDNNQLYGALPSSIGRLKSLEVFYIQNNHLVGEIPSSLGNCSALQGLSLSQNMLSGKIPAHLGNLSLLTYLSLLANDLDGPLPHQLAGLGSQLQYLSLGINHLTGSIPPWLGLFAKLYHLNLGTNRFTGSIPYQIFAGFSSNSSMAELYLDNNELLGILPSSIGGLKSLEVFYINNNHLEGEIPRSLGNCSALQDLSLSRNMLSGKIPPHLGNLSLLTSLNILSNHLNGPLPDQLAGLGSQLQYLSLGINHLTGSIPPWLGLFAKLYYLNLGTNRFTGSIPYQFFAGFSNSSMAELYLDSNELLGILPSSIGVLKSLKIFYIHNNHLEGEIPPSLGNCSALQILSMANNRFDGQIPPTLGQLLALSRGLLLSNNSLRGVIPKELGNLVQLRVLDLSRNRLVGQIPWAMKNCTSLQTWRLFSNHLTGKVTELDFSRMESLQTFTVQHNLLVGGLPPFTNSNSLVLVDLGHNNFSGSIPARPTHNPPALSKLRVLSMASNSLAGTIPDWVWDLPSLQLLDLSGNHLTGHMPHTVSHLKYLTVQSSAQINDSLTLYEEVPVTLKDSPQVLTYIINSRMLLDLSRNHLEGSISESFGELIGLTSLNLSHNRVTGHIPSSLRNLSQLESLDVSHNDLSGGIPQGLGALSSLSALNMSENQLQGPIPTLNNFDTRFDRASFEGNPGLCGFPLSNPCNAPSVAPTPSTPTSKAGPFTQKWWRDNMSVVGGLVVGYPLGFLVGLCLVCFAFKPSYRRKVISIITTRISR